MAGSCEVCGSPIRGPPNRVEIDGAIMTTCANCARMGHPVGGRPRPGRVNPAQLALKAFSQRPAEPEYELNTDYHTMVRQAREKMGISQEELGRIINEKLSVIRMIEAGRLRPDVIVTRKLMHHLKLNLLVPVSEFEKTE